MRDTLVVVDSEPDEVPLLEADGNADSERVLVAARTVPLNVSVERVALLDSGADGEVVRERCRDDVPVVNVCDRVVLPMSLLVTEDVTPERDELANDVERDCESRRVVVCTLVPRGASIKLIMRVVTTMALATPLL